MFFRLIGLLLVLIVSVQSARATLTEIIPSQYAKRLQSQAVEPADNLKSFGKDFDREVALKASQAVIGNVLDDYSFRDRDNQIVNLTELRGKPLVLSLVYTSCYVICPTTTSNLAAAVHQARSAVGDDAFTVLTVGFDTRQDTPERMRAFARQRGISRDNNWKFLSTDATTIKRFAAATGFLYVPSDKGYDHLIQTTVIDKSGRIYRQIYGMNFDSPLLAGALKELVYSLSPANLSLSSLIGRARLFCTSYDPSTKTYKFRYAMVFGMLVGVVLLLVLGVVLYRFLRYA